MRVHSSSPCSWAVATSDIIKDRYDFAGGMSKQLESSFSLAAAGDAILTRRWSVESDPGFMSVIDRINDVDAAVINLETTTHDFEGYPAPKSAGLNICSPPFILDELVWAGFNLFSVANNHSGDFSHEGMLATMRELESRRLSYAGVGRSLSEARAPAYIDTPNGRVGLVAACSTLPSKTEAGKRGIDLQGRPGVSPLRLRTEYTLPAEDIEILTAISEKLGLEAAKEHRFKPKIPDDESGFHLLKLDGGMAGAGSTMWFSSGDKPAINYRPNEADVAAILDRIDECARQADWTIASVHSHEGNGWRYNDPSVPAFLEDFARASLDAGADAFLCHGPHLLRGIEIYDNKPVFYSLGNFAAQQESLRKLPADMYDMYDLDTDATVADIFDNRYFKDGDGEPTGSIHPNQANWETIVPICRYEHGTLATIDLYPFDLGVDRPRPQRGQPRLATGDQAVRILSELQELSHPYGTDIVIEDGCGRITI